MERRLDESSKAASEAATSGQAMAARVRGLQEEVGQLREQQERGREAEADLQRQLVRSRGEVIMWRDKVQGEMQIKQEEHEEEMRNSRARIVEVEAALGAEISRSTGLEKSKNKLTSEVIELEANLEKAKTMLAGMERKFRVEERKVQEWRCKAEDLAPLLEVARKEMGERLEELQQLRKVEQEVQQESTRLRRERQDLTREVADLKVHGGEVGRRLEEAERVKRGLEGERRGLMVALEEAETELGKMEGRLVQAGLEIGQVRAEMEGRVAEVEEEAERAVQGVQVRLEAAQADLELEQRARAELGRSRKKLEADVTELEVSVDLAKKQVAEQVVVSRKWEVRCGEALARVEEEARSCQMAKEATTVVERKVASLTTKLEEAQMAANQAERSRKKQAVEAGELEEQVAGLRSALEAHVAGRRRLEGEVLGLQAELEEGTNKQRLAEERLREASGEAARLSEEVRSGREAAIKEDQTRRSAEAHAREAVLRADEAEAALARARSTGLEHLEGRVREVQGELEAEQQRCASLGRDMRQAERGRREAEAEVEVVGRRAGLLQVTSPTPSLARTRCAASRAG